MNQQIIDTDKVLQCVECQRNISPIEDKMVLGAHIKGEQHFYIFHLACWASQRFGMQWDKKK